MFKHFPFILHRKQKEELHIKNTIPLSSIFNNATFTGDLYFLLWLLVSYCFSLILAPFCFSLKDYLFSLKDCLKADLLALNSLSFCFSGNFLISASILGSFVNNRILIWPFFYFQNFNYMIPLSFGLHFFFFFFWETFYSLYLFIYF